MPILQDSLTPPAAAGTPPAAAGTPPAAAGTPAGMPPPAAAGTPAALPPPNPAISCPAVQAHMGSLADMRRMMDGKLGNAYDRVVAAGKKMLYSPESADAVNHLLDDDEVPLANKLGEGVANLMVMMDNTANGTMPKEVLIPAGIAIMFEAADWVFEIGVPVSEKDLADGMEKLIYGIYSGYNIPPEKVDEVITKLGKKMGFKEGAGDKVMGAVEDAQEAGKVREPIPGDNPQEEAAEGAGDNPQEEAAEGAGDNPQEEAAEQADFDQAFNKRKGV